DMGLADVQFDFRAGISEYTMKPGEVLVFKLRGSVLVFLSSNKSEIEDLIGEAGELPFTNAEGDGIELRKINRSDLVDDVGSGYNVLGWWSSGTNFMRFQFDRLKTIVSGAIPRYTENTDDEG